MAHPCLVSHDERGSGGADGAPADPLHRSGDTQDWTSGDLSHVVIPDDISELADDLRAYRRELRSTRRHRRLARVLHGRRAVVVPVILVLALIVGSYSAVVLVAGTAPPIGHGGEQLARPPTAPGQIGGLLPALNVSDSSGAQQNLRSLRPGALLLVPGNCNCDDTVANLDATAHRAGAPLYLVSTQLPRPAAGVGPERTFWRAEYTGQLLPAYGATRSPVLLVVRADGVVQQVYKTPPPSEVLLPELQHLG